MTKIIAFSVLIVFLLVIRSTLYRWLNERDPLPKLLRQGLDAVLAYFAYMTAGLLVLSLIAGKGFGGSAESQAVAVAITIGSAAYVGIGIFALWRFLSRSGPPGRGRR